MLASLVSYTALCALVIFLGGVLLGNQIRLSEDAKTAIGTGFFVCLVVAIIVGLFGNVPQYISILFIGY